MQFTIKWNVVVQVCATALHVLNYSIDVVPPKYKPLVTLGIGILQSISALAAHYVNPDGSPATTPSQPTSPQK